MSKVSLKQQAYTTIKNKILTCEYLPNSFLNEDLLCEELQVSRTPVRDALGRLEQENLIKIVPKKGFFVTPLSVGEINMAFEARLLIEPYIILNYCNHLTSEVLDKLYANSKKSREYISSNNHNEVFKLDDEFHKEILNQCNNHYLLQTLNTVHNQNSRLRIISGRYGDNRLNETIDEHAKILDCLAKRDVVGAAKAMEDHLLTAKNSAFDAFIGNRTQDLI